MALCKYLHLIGHASPVPQLISVQLSSRSILPVVIFQHHQISLSLSFISKLTFTTHISRYNLFTILLVVSAFIISVHSFALLNHSRSFTKATDTLLYREKDTFSRPTNNNQGGSCFSSARAASSNCPKTTLTRLDHPLLTIWHFWLICFFFLLKNQVWLLAF